MRTYKFDNAFLAILLLICFSCKSKIEAQKQKADSSSNMENKKPTFSEKDIYKKNNPNTIELIAEVISIEHNLTLCGKDYENIVILKSQKIISSGTGIINMLNEKKTFKAIVNKKLLLNNKKSPDLLFKKGDLLQINIIEQLCIDTSKTTYLMSNFKKL